MNIEYYTHSCNQFAFDEGHRHGPIMSRISGYLSIVAAHPDMAPRYHNMFRRRRHQACGIYAHNVSRESDESFTDYTGRIEWRDIRNEVASLEAFGFDPSLFNNTLAVNTHSRYHRWTSHLVYTDRVRKS